MPAPLVNFSLDPLGNLYATDGFRAVKCWNGLLPASIQAGVPSPDSSLHAVGGGGGTLGGTVYAAQRFLDQYGNPSNLIIDSTPIVLTNGSGNVLNVFNVPGAGSSVYVTLDNSPSGNWITLAGVTGATFVNGTVSIVPATGSIGSFTFPPNSFVLSSYLNGNSVFGTVAYTGGGTWIGNSGSITYTFDAVSDSRVVTRQLCRSQDGEASVFYVDVTLGLGGAGSINQGSASSSKTDAQLGEAIPLEDTNGDDLAIARFGLPPADKPVFAQMNSRFLGFGYPAWTQGKVAVTHSSTTVTGQNTGWTADMELVGRVLTVPGGGGPYVISSLNAAAQTITLTSGYTGSTSISTGYAILPDAGAGRRTFDFSDAQYSGAFNPLDSLAVPEDPLAGASVGLLVQDRIAYFCGENRVWRVSFQQSPTIDGAQALGPQRGLLNPRCAVAVENSVYLMDRQGIYVILQGQITPIDTPIHDLFDSQRPQPYQINFRWSQYFHAVHDPERETIRWFVSMSGRFPRHAICYQYRFQRWWIEEFPFAVTSSALGSVAGRPVVFLGCEGRKIFAADTGFCDGVQQGGGTTLRGNITSAGPTWFQSNNAVFDPTWPSVCAAVTIVSGTGSGQQRRLVKIDSTKNTKYHVDRPWTVRPDTTSVFEIGGVAWSFQSGRYRLSEGNVPGTPDDQQVNRKIELVFQPTVNDSFINLNLFYDHNATPTAMQYARAAADNNGVTVTAGSPNIQIDTAEQLGRVQLPIPGQRETRSGGRAFLSVALQGVTNGERHRVYQLSLRGLQP